MSRRTEHDAARDLLAELKSRGFALCEKVPVEFPTYLEGDGAKEWMPISDKRAVALLEMLILTELERSRS